MNHAELLDAGGAVKYEGQDVPKFACVDCLGDAYQHTDHDSVRQALDKLARSGLDGYNDVMYIFNWRKARQEARKEIE